MGVLGEDGVVVTDDQVGGVVGLALQLARGAAGHMCGVAAVFGGQQVGFPPATDPCALPSAATDTTIRDLCIATGVPAADAIH